MKDFHKKESPLLALTGLGGGLGYLAGGVAVDPTYIDDVFSTYLYDGNGSDRTITNGINLADEGGIVWTKCRNDTPNHEINYIDGTTRYSLYTDNTNSASITDLTDTSSYSSDVDQYNSNGYRIKNGGANTNSNVNSREYVSWTFRKAPGFFDVVRWDGNGTNGRIVPHNLGTVPGMIIVKSTSTSSQWIVYHRSLGAGHYVILDDNTTKSNFDSGASNSRYWNNTAPTSTSFTLSDDGWVNSSGRSYIAYIFAHDDQSFGTNGDESIVKCGSYTGSSSSFDLNLGFEPQWVMIKRATGSGNNFTNWAIFDNMRGVVSDGDDTLLAPNLTTAENGTYMYASTELLEFTPTGITIDPTNAQNTVVNSNSETYIYMAIRRPNKPPTAGTDVFNPSTQVGTVPNFSAPWPVDLGIRLLTGGGNTTYSQMAVARLTGEKFMATSQQTAEAVPSGFTIDWDHMDGWGDMGGGGTGLSFKRAPGFLDVVNYTGTGSAQNINHNLGVKPELIITKRRDNSGSWAVYAEPLTATDRLRINFDGGRSSISTYWNDTEPTSSVFTVGSDGNTGASGTFIAYLFASLNGISKVGSYTGTGSDGINVDCGFTSGARFVMIKRTDSTGGWFVWDSSRGIVSGNDPWIRLNTTGAQDTSTDYIDPLNSGFIVNGSSSAQINASGGTYLFLAIA